MVMKESEIVRNYNGAANKEYQLHVLADLNCTDTKTIREILVRNGIPEEELPALRKGRPKGESRPVKKKMVKKAVKKPEGATETPVIPESIKEECFRAPEDTRNAKKLVPARVPDAAIMICRSRLELLTEQIIGIEKEKERLMQLSMEYEKERDALADYLRGVTVNV